MDALSRHERKSQGMQPEQQATFYPAETGRYFDRILETVKSFVRFGPQ